MESSQASECQAGHRHGETWATFSVVLHRCTGGLGCMEMLYPGGFDIQANPLIPIYGRGVVSGGSNSALAGGISI